MALEDDIKDIKDKINLIFDYLSEKAKIEKHTFVGHGTCYFPMLTDTSIYSYRNKECGRDPDDEIHQI